MYLFQIIMSFFLLLKTESYILKKCWKPVDLNSIGFPSMDLNVFSFLQNILLLCSG